MNKIDISTEEKKQEVYKIFDSLENKNQIHKYYKISDNTQGSEYIKQIANEIGFDFNIYKERKRKFCLHCGKEIVGKGKSSKKFCNSSCAASYNNKQRGKHSEETKQKISQSLKKEEFQNENNDIFCLYCGKKLTGNQTKYCSVKCKNHSNFHKNGFKKNCEICGKLFTSKYPEQKYCSIKCSNKNKNNLIIDNWLNDNFEITSKIPHCIRKLLYKTNNYKCEICNFEGYNSKTGNTILQIHHIDGDCTNNNKNNLQVLCPNCHTMTDNYMALNKGKSKRTKRKLNI